MNKYKKYLMFFSLPLILTGCSLSNSPKLKEELAPPTLSQQTRNNVLIKQNLEKKFNEFEKQSVQVSKDIQYTRIDPIQMREPNQYIIWTRADVVEIDSDYLYVMPEGYRIIQETSGEFYINCDPIKENEVLLIDKK